MDSSVPENSTNQSPDRDTLHAIVVAQANFIDTVLTRLIILDRDFNPTTRGNWPAISAGRAIAAQETPPRMAQTP